MSGVTIMKMMSSTSMTSIIGVTLMSPRYGARALCAGMTGRWHPVVTVAKRADYGTLSNA